MVKDLEVLNKVNSLLKDISILSPFTEDSLNILMERCLWGVYHDINRYIRSGKTKTKAKKTA